MPDDFNKNTSIEDEIEKSLQKMVEEETTVAKAYVGKADDYKAEQPSDINDGRTRVVPKITDEILKEQQVINKSSQPTQEELTDFFSTIKVLKDGEVVEGIVRPSTVTYIGNDAFKGVNLKTTYSDNTQFITKLINK